MRAEGHRSPCIFPKTSAALQVVLLGFTARTSLASMSPVPSPRHQHSTSSGETEAAEGEDT